MKTFILAAIVAAVLAAEYVFAYHGHGGHSSSHHHHDGHGYKFGYDITDPHGAKNSRKESGDGYGNTHGQYTIYDKDGRKRIVEYVADKKGFRAKIHSNEPGLQSHHAAHAKYDVEHHGYHGGHHDDGHGYGHGHGGHGHGHGHGHGYKHEKHGYHDEEEHY